MGEHVWRQYSPAGSAHCRVAVVGSASVGEVLASLLAPLPEFPLSPQVYPCRLRRCVQKVLAAEKQRRTTNVATIEERAQELEVGLASGWEWRPACQVFKLTPASLAGGQPPAS